ncbi:MAG: terpene cyclase/mutase family protein [Phycisphaerales bacterium]|nr:terpene cyclase/mutase family protein [Phycisphaerales bacterium]
MTDRTHRLIIALLATCVVSATTFAADGEKLSPELRKRTDAAIDRGLAFLRNAQAPDGGWRAFENTDPAFTALAAKCFAQAPDYGPKHEVTQRAFDFIAKSAQPDGGIYIPDEGHRNYYTSVAVMALALSPEMRHREIVAKAQKFLTGLQWDEAEGYEKDQVFYGGAGYGHGKRPDLSNTQMMLEALHDSGLSPENPVYKKALVFISRCQMLPETNDQPFAAGGDGGFIYSAANGGESKAGTDERDGRKVLRCYGSMTYSGFKSMLYAGLAHDDPRVRAAYDWIRQNYTLDANPNMPDAQAQQGLFYFYHVFARAMQAWGEDTIVDAKGGQHDWRADLCEKLISLQHPDGSWINPTDRWYESNPNLVTAYSVLALQATLK